MWLLWGIKTLHELRSVSFNHHRGAPVVAKGNPYSPLPMGPTLLQAKALGPFLCMHRMVHCSSPQTEGIQSSREACQHYIDMEWLRSTQVSAILDFCHLEFLPSWISTILDFKQHYIDRSRFSSSTHSSQHEEIFSHWASKAVKRCPVHSKMFCNT